MSAPKKGIEVDLKEFGCPYEPADPRTIIWIEGYRAGHRSGSDMAKNAIFEAFGVQA